MLTETTKKCFKCDEELPLSHFYKHPKMADGHVNKCRECNKKDVRANYADKSEYYREYDKIRGQDTLSPRMTNRRETLKSSARSSSKNPLKIIVPAAIAKKASTAVSNAIRAGRMESGQNCFCCGADYCVHAHHSSYDEEMWLVVTWLCASCHSRLHKDFEYLTGSWRPDIYHGFQ